MAARLWKTVVFLKRYLTTLSGIAVESILHSILGLDDALILSLHNRRPNAEALPETPPESALATSRTLPILR